MAYVRGDYITAAGLNSWNGNNREEGSVGGGYWKVYGICHTLKKGIGYAYGYHSNNWIGTTYAYSCDTFNPGLSDLLLVQYFMRHGTELYRHGNWPFGPSWSTTVHVSSPSSTQKLLFGMFGESIFGSSKYELIKGQIDCVQGTIIEGLSNSWDLNFRYLKPSPGFPVDPTSLNGYLIGTYGHG